MMDWGSGWNGSGSNWFLMGGMMLFWIAVVGLGIWLVLRVTDRDHKQVKSIDTPRAILDRRFASGEISVEQYAAARKLIEAHALSAH
jgi:putative membrane protein